MLLLPHILALVTALAAFTTPTDSAVGVSHTSVAAAAFVCPAVDSSIVVQYPSPTSCSVFYKCNRGAASAVSCPDGLHYSAREQVCDFPVRANCHLAGKI